MKNEQPQSNIYPSGQSFLYSFILLFAGICGITVGVLMLLSSDGAYSLNQVNTIENANALHMHMVGTMMVVASIVLLLLSGIRLFIPVRPEHTKRSSRNGKTRG